MNKYEFYDKRTDRLLAVGTVQEIADKLGFKPQSVRQIITKCSNGDMDKYRIEHATPAYNRRNRVRRDAATNAVIAEWDKLTGFERKKRGIPRWQGHY